MPKVINNQSTADQYTDANTIQNVYESKGGWIVNNAQLLCQLQRSEGAQQGSEQFGDEFLLTSGAHHLEPGTTGIRVRSAVSGQPVVFSVAIFFPYETGMVLGGSGIATPSTSVASLNFQHNDIAVATEPTADFEDESTGNNLTWTVVDDVANTRVKITPVWKNPTIFPYDISNGPLTSGIGGANTGVYLDTFGRIVSIASAVGFTLLAASLNGDTFSRLGIDHAGNITWGTGALAGDATFGRINAGVLGSSTTSLSTGPTSVGVGGATPGVFLDNAGRIASIGSATGTTLIAASITGDTSARFSSDHNGALSWGPGNTAQDLTISRLITGGTTALSISSTGTQAITTGAVPNAFTSLGWVTWSSVQETIGSAAGNNAFVTAVQNDTQFRFGITIAGTLSWGPGNAVADISLLRSSKGPDIGLGIAGTATGWFSAGGAIYSGSSTTTGSNDTWTIDFSTGNFQTHITNVSGATTLTIATPSNNPAAGQTSWLAIKIRNTGTSGSTTLTWSGNFTFNSITQPTSVNFGASIVVFFIWDSDASVWRAIGKF